uniref:Transposase n=1 Tax=Candidatus Kentrum sp. TUN TaxID=2126343 RepID=A0A451AEC8_9GAMM|nr:MAG: hypothetical protein BECKTUN1418F_GA0071002_14932 [Candidatus Kentron sp. TUN]
MLWCYEAGPCGYVLYHQLMELGEECHVVAPSKTPRVIPHTKPQFTGIFRLTYSTGIL